MDTAYIEVQYVLLCNAFYAVLTFKILCSLLFSFLLWSSLLWWV